MARSVAKNALYSGIRTISFMLFPLITYPYVTRVLLVDNLGRVDFSISLVSYFLLIAGLGVTTYATRTGATLREDRTQLDAFASEVFTINMASTLLAYASLAALVALWPHLHGYAALIAIQSLSIIGTTLGVEWVYTLEEDYAYITIRTVLVQVVSAVLLFALVRRPEDYLVYAAITVLSGVGGNLFNWFRARRYATIRLVWGFDWRRHLLPMLVLFGNAIAVTIYVNIDISLLNVMRGDYEVGIYGLSSKIYKMVKQLLNAIITVSLPRLSLYVAQNNRTAYDSLLENMAHALLILVVPALTMLALMAPEVVLLIGGEAYMEAVSSLRMLCAAGFFAVAGNFFVSAILLPHGGEELVLRATVIGAVVNLLLNFVFIPLAGATGAAATTVIAEACVVTTAAWYARANLDLRALAGRLARTLAMSAAGMTAMAVAYVALHSLALAWLPAFFVRGCVLAGVYAIVLLACRDSLVLQGLKSLAMRTRHREQ